uniref:NADH dehydrogenase subunit 2 n=1 Tax=Arorathrips mexicanus TaxID=1291224 RepID=UPI0030E5D21D
MKNIFFFQKFLFLMSLMMSILISISSNSLIGIWMGMEINLFSVITMFSMNEKKNSEKAILIYFLVQSISSVMMLFSSMMMTTNFSNTNIFMIMFFLSLFMKLGMFPFHFWMLATIEGLSWTICFILLTIQKIIPLITMMMMMQKKMIIFMIIMNSIAASISGLSSFSLRKIMSFSSMNHLSLMLLSAILSKNMLKLYFFVYTIMSFISVYLFNKNNLNFIFQVFSIPKNKMLMMNFLITFFSMAGIPPFMGFIPKMIVIMKMTEFLIILPMILILITNTVASFFYIRMCFSNLLMNMNMKKTLLKTDKSWFIPLILIFSPMIYIM